jgi:hypothetical protein
VLVVQGHGFELSMLANYVAARQDLLSGEEVVIRPYTFDWLEARERGIQRLRRLGVRFRVSDERLPDQLGWCDLVLFSSTTAGLQAMLAGRLVAYVELHDILEADPLWGNEACFARCATPDELASALARARELPDA